jgi:tRNA(adenine34) deaminase
MRLGERPFGCVITTEYDVVIATSSGSELLLDVTRHSELVAIRQAQGRMDGLLRGCTLYSTHEPCLMCAGACCHAKLSRVVFGSYRNDLPLLFRKRRLPVEVLLEDTSQPPEVVSGVLRDECIRLFDQEMAAHAAAG